MKDCADFQVRFDFTQNVSFCIDMAHAFVFGYNVHEESSKWI
jgi:hypothetical protein